MRFLLNSPTCSLGNTPILPSPTYRVEVPVKSKRGFKASFLTERGGFELPGLLTQLFSRQSQ